MFINQDLNTIKDDEIEDNVKNKKGLFKKKKKEINNGEVDFNNQYIQENKKYGDLFKIIRTLVIFAVFILFVIIGLPKILHYNDQGKKEYIDNVKLMVDKAILYYTDDSVKCKTTKANTYYFNVNKSTDMFGNKVISPFLKDSLQGYIEFDVKKDGTYKVYVSFTDGLFGFERVEVNKLTEGNIKIFPYLAIDHPEEMICNKPFDNSKYMRYNKSDR